MTNPERIAKGLWWDRAWSLVSGCTPVSPGCDHCWAASEAHMRAGQKNQKIRDRYAGLTEGGKWTGQIRLMEKNLDLPLHVRKPTVWAVWNDLFHEAVPFDFIGKVFARMHNTRYHTFLVLTKRPERMAEFINWYKTDWLAGFEYAWPKEYQHVWLGTTCENQEQADKRIPVLLQIPAAVRFVSVEPMLSGVDLGKWIGDQYCSACGYRGYDVGPEGEDGEFTCPKCGADEWYFTSTDVHGGLEKDERNPISLVICGSESGPGRRPTDINCIRSLRDQCVASGTRFFLKQMDIGGKLVKMPVLDGRTWSEMPGA